MLHAVIMAGGSGTRFWPQSRERFPKQFLTLKGDRSLLQGAYDRIAPLVGAERVMIVTNALQREQTLTQLPTLNPNRVVGEPMGRDTAACIALAAELVRRNDPEANLIVLAADHLIQPPEKFMEAVSAADSFLKAHPEAIITFGVKPTSPSTAYGYLNRSSAEKPTTVGSTSVHRLQSFHEKPNLETAQRFVAEGTYFWNSGIFAWKAATIIGEIEKFQPEIAAAVKKIANAWRETNVDTVFASEYASAPKISIDFAVMEKTKNPIHMIEAPFEWDDVGSWLALERLHPADDRGNVAVGKHLAIDSSGCTIVSAGDHLVAALGVENLIIVHTPDATLVADKRQEQAVKKLIEELKRRGMDGWV
jgi:mannose-1-phosphate guanylyltransferase